MSGDERQQRVLDALTAALEGLSKALGGGDRPSDDPPIGTPPHPASEHNLGKRQRQIVDVPGLATSEGMKTADVAAAIDYEVPNTYTTLQALARAQMVEQVPGREPQRWRLAARYRQGPRTFARLTDLVAAGEWTTPGDVSIAAQGDTRSADAIARAGLSHRVAAGGALDAEARARLEAEGIPFDAAGRPDPGRRVAWDELARRLDAAEQQRARTARGAMNYIEIPALDLDRSISFYETIFGWKVRRRPAHASFMAGSGQTSYPEFVDSSGRMGGGFVLGRAPTREPGLILSIAVERIDDVLEAVLDNGGEIARPRTAIVEGSDWTAMFRDPAGNVFALYEAAR